MRNGVLAGVVQVLAGLCIYGVKAVAGGSELGVGDVVVLYLALLAIGLVSGAAEGVLSGAVLQRVVPMLPGRGWVVLNALLTTGIILLATSPSGSSPREGAPPADVPVAGIVLFGFVLGALLAAFVGAVQSLMLHKVAFGTPTWIAGSAFAGGVIYAAALALHTGPAAGFAAELTTQLVWLALAVLQAALMLPALCALRPRAMPQDVF